LPQLKAGNGRKNEIAVFGGVSILNRGGGDRDSVGYAVEYRRDIADYVQWSVAFLDEGKKGNMERRGGATQLWLAGHFGDKLSLGLGGGYYLAHDDYRNTWENDFIVSATAAYPVSNRLNIRFSFDRIAAPRDGDADLIRVGIGYRF